MLKMKKLELKKPKQKINGKEVFVMKQSKKINGRELTELHRYHGTGAPRSWVAPRLLFGILGVCFLAIG